MPGESLPSLGTVIKARRHQLGWNQAQLAERVAAHGDWTFRQSDVSRLERGQVRLPHRERLIHIAAVLELPLGELLALSGWAGTTGADSTAPSPPSPPPVAAPCFRDTIDAAQALIAHAKAVRAKSEQIRSARASGTLEPSELSRSD
jgi:hypothetical protein